MGRHSSPGQGHFYRSLVTWLLPWVVMAAFILIAVWVAIDAVSGDDLETNPVARETRSAEPEPTESDTPEPVDTPEPDPEETKEPKKKREREREVALITEDITVQVLNGTGSTDADDRMADRLGSLGYEVVAIEGSSKQYSATTVFWSYPDARAAAEALADRFGWIAQPKPSNLSSTVDIHVVVGDDEA